MRYNFSTKIDEKLLKNLIQDFKMVQLPTLWGVVEN